MRSLKREFFSFVTNTCLSIMFRRIKKPATIQLLAITIRLYQLPNIFQSTSVEQNSGQRLVSTNSLRNNSNLRLLVRSYHEFEWCT